MPPKNGTSADDDSESGEDDFIKGVPDEEEDEFENSAVGGTGGPSGASATGEFDPNFAATGAASNWEGAEGEAEGGYPQEEQEEGFAGTSEYGEESIDPFTGGPEEDVDVDGAVEGEGEEDEAARAREQEEEDEEEENEDDEDVDVDDDTGKSRKVKGAGFEDSDIDIGGDASRGPDDESSNADVTSPTYTEDDDQKDKERDTQEVPMAPSVVFEPEYEPLDFEHGNVLHREAFYPDWEKVVTDKVDEAEEVLVPIRLDLAVDNARIQDTFVWNLKEKSITPDQYAEMLCVDLDLPQRAERIIADSIRQQLGEYRDLVPPVPAATARPAPPGTIYNTLPECLVTIKVDLTVNQVLLHDQFEWDVNNPSNSPEPFARSLCQDLGLSREFETSIAHSIREQLAYHAQFAVPFLQQMHSRAHAIVTPERCVRDDAELPLWTPVVSNVTPAQRAAPGMGVAGFPYGTPQGPVRHSSRLREAASSGAAPYSLRAGSTPNR